MRIGNLSGIPWYARLAIFVVIAGFVYAGFWYFVTSGTRKETKGLLEQVAPVHGKQLLTYLRLTGQPRGVLLNFGAATFKEGIRRVVNGHTNFATSRAPKSTSPRFRLSSSLMRIALPSSASTKARKRKPGP